MFHDLFPRKFMKKCVDSITKTTQDAFFLCITIHMSFSTQKCPARLFDSQFQGFVCIEGGAEGSRRVAAYPASFSACQLHISMSLRIAAGIAQPSGSQASPTVADCIGC